MKAKLLNCLPSIHWTPSDLPPTTPPHQKPHHHRRTHALFASASRKLNPTEQSHHGGATAAEQMLCRQSTVSMVDEAAAKRTAGQGQSSFFARLPAELRGMVYGFVMGRETVHLTLGAKKRYGHFVCESEGEGEGQRAAGMECGCKVLVGGKAGRRLGAECTRLLMTCRRIYSEAVPYLYTPHTFSLLHLTHLLYLPTRLPMPGLNIIRTLRLRWAIRALPYLRRGPSKRLAYPEDTSHWTRGWEILAGMQGLRDLYVVLVDLSRDAMWERNWNEVEAFLLEPVKEVTKPRRFELVLPYASCGLQHDMGNSPVRLRNSEVDDDDDDDKEEHVRSCNS